MISTAHKLDILKLFFLSTAIPDLAENDSSSPATNLYASLHNGPVNAGDAQNTNETAYTGYNRKAVSRAASGGAFGVSGNTITNIIDIIWDMCTGGTDTITHWGLGKASSGTGYLMYSGSLAKSNQGQFTAKADDTITIPGHTFSVNDRIALYAENGSSLPTGITEGVLYHVLTVSGDDITISTTSGGSVLNITAVGDGVAYKADTLAVSNNIIPTVQAGDMVID